MRDRVARWLATFALTRIATRQYGTTILGAIEYGMRAAAQDTRLGREDPPDWRILTRHQFFLAPGRG